MLWRSYHRTSHQEKNHIQQIKIKTINPTSKLTLKCINIRNNSDIEVYAQKENKLENISGNCIPLKFDKQKPNIVFGLYFCQ